MHIGVRDAHRQMLPALCLLNTLIDYKSVMDDILDVSLVTNLSKNMTIIHDNTTLTNLLIAILCTIV